MKNSTRKNKTRTRKSKSKKNQKGGWNWRNSFLSRKLGVNSRQKQINKQFARFQKNAQKQAQKQAQKGISIEDAMQMPSNSNNNLNLRRINYSNFGIEKGPNQPKQPSRWEGIF